MPTYTVQYYAYDPRGNLPNSGIFTYGGPSTYAGSALITDTQTGTDGAGLDDDNAGENATVDITLGGTAYTGLAIDAEESWTLINAATGQEFNVVAVEVDTPGGNQWIMLSEAPLVAGTAYTVTSHDTLPDGGTDDPGFVYSFYEDGVITGTSGDDTIDTTYAGDPEGERVDDGILNGGVFHWNDLGDQTNYMNGSGSLTSEGMTMNFAVVDDGTGQIAYDPTGNGAYNANGYTESGEVFDPDSTMFLFGDRGAGDGADTMTMTMDFSATTPANGLSDEVRNVSFRLNDLDQVTGGFTDVITIRAYDALGNEVPVAFDIAASQSLSGNTVTGTGSTNTGDQNGSLLVNIAGPVASIVIDYDNTGTSTQGVWMSDVAFDASYPDYDDVIEAGDGDDMIDAGLGDDIIYGGTGNDTIMGGLGADQNYGGNGQDTLDYSGSDAGVNVNLATNTYSGGYAAGDTGSGMDGVIGSDFDDTLIGYDAMDPDPVTGFTNVFYGGDGDDYLDGAGGDDDLYGEAGEDTILGGAGDDYIDGGTGDDTLDGGDGDDDIYAGAGDDIITGGAGNDNLHGNAGSDWVDGGDGDDYINTRTTLGTGLPDTGYTHPDDPALSYGADTNPTNDMDTVYGGAGNDTILTGDDNDYIEGGTGADSVDAGFDDDTVLGGAGDDLLEGNEGNDTIYGGDDDDIIYGELGPTNADYALSELYNLDDAGETTSADTDPTNNSDTLYGGAGNDTIYGQDDADTLYGEDGDDTLDGGVDDDNLSGGAGNDTLIGGQGNDTLNGDGGYDILNGGLGDDIIYAGSGDTANGGDGSDIIYIDPSQLDGTAITIDGEETNDTGAGDMLNLSLLGPGLYTPGSAVFTTPDEENGSVTLSDGTVITFANIETIICFGRGTRIETPYGPRPVESLREGDLILTMDNGPQSLRWVGSREVPALGTFAPIEFAAGAMGNTETLIVSPQHRMLMQDWRAQVLFDTEQVFTAATHLVNGGTIRRLEGGTVEYFHLMFDGHEVVFAEGAPSESLYPSDHTLGALDDAGREELFQIFPDLRAMPYAAHPTARRCLKGYETKLLIA